MRIRPATLSDLNEIIAIRQAAISLRAPEAYSAREVDELLGQVDDAGFEDMVLDVRLFVAERDEGLLLGSAGWTDGCVRHVHVRPDHERMGIGTRLVRYVEEDIQRRRHDGEIRVNATRNAEAFYTANGYERLPDDPTASTLFIPMQKQLGS